MKRIRQGARSNTSKLQRAGFPYRMSGRFCSIVLASFLVGRVALAEPAPAKTDAPNPTVGVWRGIMEDQVQGMGEYGRFRYLYLLTVRTDGSVSMEIANMRDGFPPGTRSGRTITWTATVKDMKNPSTGQLISSKVVYSLTVAPDGQSATLTKRLNMYKPQAGLITGSARMQKLK
jgi:hypothetical protein